MEVINQLIESQKDFFNTNQTKSVQFRIEQLKKIKKLVKENKQLLFDAIYADFSKSAYDTFLTEISQIYHETDILIRKTKKWSKRKRVATGIANFPGKSFIIPEPLGTTLVIGAWNYPIQLSLIPAITSLAAGNTVIIKPSELPSKTANAIAQIINKNFDAHYFHVVEGGIDKTTALLNNHFDKIFFTGSIPVGKIIYQAAAKHLTPVTLELGGKSPTFVMADCNLKMAAKRIAWAKYLNAGQTCVAPDYVLVEKSIESQFLEALKTEIETFHTSDDLAENYVQIINERNFDRLNSLIDIEKVYHGGETIQEQRIIRPTVLNNVTFEDKVMKDEIFGPILPVISFTSLDEVIAKVKERSKPLSCYIYSRNKKTINKILSEVSFGGGCINDSIMHLSNSNLPFGGVGFSGMGSYHGKAGFETFSHYKSILSKPNQFEMPLKYAPYKPWKWKILRSLFN